jgi:hypothetical protein
LQQLRDYFLHLVHHQTEIGLVKGKEKGWDIHILNEFYKKYGKNSRFILPEDLSVNEEGQLCDGARPLDFIILELHQDELEKLSDKVLSAMVHYSQQHKLVNPLSTIMLLHDKRLLSLPFEREDIMHSLNLSPEDVALIQSAIPTSYRVDTLTQEQLHEVRVNQHDYILKANLSGKGDGIYFGQHHSQEEWVDLLRDPSHGHFILQKRIPTLKLPLGPQGENCFFVGTLICLEDQNVFPGILRFNPGPIVNGGQFVSVLYPDK